MIWRLYLCVKQRFKDVILADRFKRALSQNEQAAAELDAVVRSILQK
jgi:hypothetical protein